MLSCMLAPFHYLNFYWRKLNCSIFTNACLTQNLLKSLVYKAHFYGHLIALSSNTNDNDNAHTLKPTTIIITEIL